MIQKNITHEGDGWVVCPVCNVQHWGLNGAAGILVVRFDKNNKVSHLLLQHRGYNTACGGTWGAPSGAIANSESALEGAIRELYEEANVSKDQIEILGDFKREHEHGGWSFTNFVAKEIKKTYPKDNCGEAIDVRWVLLSDLENIPLLPPFEKDLKELIQIAQINNNG